MAATRSQQTLTRLKHTGMIMAATGSQQTGTIIIFKREVDG